MPLYIFSDAHLGSASPQQEAEKIAGITALFDLVKTDGDRLVILGDLFDFWFEYKHAIPKDHHEVLFMLHDLIRHGVRIDYVSGNHDFWMDDFFEKQVGIVIHRDYFDLKYGGLRLHMIHGDGLAPGDRGYRVLKRILRNRLNIWLYRKLPPDWAFPLARFVSGSSRDYTNHREHEFAADYETYASRKIESGFDAVIIGHLHTPVCKTIGNGTYVNTGDFIDNFSYVKLDGDLIMLEYLK